MHELALMDAWLLEELTADEALAALVAARVFNVQVPAGTAFPYVVFQLHVPGTDVMAVGTHRLAVQATYIVRAVDESPSVGLAAQVAEKLR